jgi:hypothetical protein
MKAWTQNLVLAAFGLLVSLLMLEGLSRVVMPLSPGVHLVDLEGHAVTLHRRGEGLTPGITVRQISNEYDALTTITPKGHRVPEVNGSPDVIFIGDSFTFGVGLKDEDTFAYRYCHAAHLECANLGVPGTGTGFQLDTLERFVTTYQWQPKRVLLFMTVMTSALFNGNDLEDNLQYAEAMKRKQQLGPKARPLSLGIQKTALAYSNLFRLAKYYWGPLLRQRLTPAMNEAVLARALDVTKEQLDRLDVLSHQHGFTYEIYLLHPMQDILRGTYRDTEARLRAIAPGRSVFDTAPLFVADPRRYYFSFDGHLNPEGAAQVATFLASGRS